MHCSSATARRSACTARPRFGHLSLKATANLSGFGVTFFRLLSCFSSFHSFLPSSFASSPRSVHLLFVLTTIFFFTTSSLSLSFSPVLSLNLKLLCLRGQGSDFSVKITLFQLLTRTQLHSYFAPVLLPFMNEIKMHLHQHYRRTCRKKLVFGLLGWALLLLRRRRTQLPTTKPIHSHHPFNDDDDGRGKFVDVLGCWRERERD